MTEVQLSSALQREPIEKELRGNVQVYYYSIGRAYKMDPPTSPHLGNPLVVLGYYALGYGVNTAQAEANRQISLLQVIFDDGGLSWSGRFGPDTSDPAGRRRMDKVAEAYGRLINEEMRGERPTSSRSMPSPPPSETTGGANPLTLDTLLAKMR